MLTANIQVSIKLLTPTTCDLTYYN